MALKTVLYTGEDAENDFVKRLIETASSWEKSQNQRTHRPLYDGQCIRRNENGIGLEIAGLPLVVPALYVDVALTAVVIEEDYLSGDGVLKAGTYRRGQTTAIVSMSVCRPENRPVYGSWKIQVTGKTLAASIRFYNDIRTGKIEPRVAWPSELDNKQ